MEAWHFDFAETRGTQTRRIPAQRRSTGSGDPHARCCGTIFRELLRRSRESPALAFVSGTRRGRGSGTEALSHALDWREDREPEALPGPVEVSAPAAALSIQAPESQST